MCYKIEQQSKLLRKIKSFSNGVEDNQLYFGVTGFIEDIADDRWVVLTQEFQKGDWHGH